MPRKKSAILHSLHKTTDPRNGISNPVTLPVIEKVITPSYLPRQAQLAYKKLAVILQSRGLLTELDLPLVEAWSVAYSVMREAVESLKSKGALYESKRRMYVNPASELVKRSTVTMRDISLRFGLSPKDRQAIETPIETEDDENDNPANWSEDDLGLYAEEL